MKARQRLAALTAATSITLSIVWALSSYAYGGMPLSAAASTASGIVQVRACS